MILLSGFAVCVHILQNIVAPLGENLCCLEECPFWGLLETLECLPLFAKLFRGASL